jgi:hypothetical protein
MTQKVIYDHTGTVARVLHQEDQEFDGTFHIETVEDLEPILDSVKVLRDDHKERGDLKHVARIPVTVVEQAMREGWYHDDAKWRQWLNDPQNKDFRVWEGRV